MKDKSVCILGGAGFIGSHLTEALVDAAKRVIVVDNYSTGRNFVKGATYCYADLRDYHSTLSFIKQCDIVFHLAADVGGRGYLEGKNTWSNVELDATVFRACKDVEKLVYFSSALVYPPNGTFSETQVCDLALADGSYGKGKLIGEMMLKDFAFDSASIRPFTVYGERMKENRSIGALIAKTFIKQDPFEVWGDGDQVVDYVYVKDVVKAAVFASWSSGFVNVGSEFRETPMTALEIIWDYTGWRPNDIVFRKDKPVSQERISRNTRLNRLGWQPSYTFKSGLERTVDWYFRTHSVNDVRKSLEERLVTV